MFERRDLLNWAILALLIAALTALILVRSL